MSPGRSPGMVAPIAIREYVPADRAEVVDLMRSSLGERSGERTEEFFSWKHERNVFGPSPAWVATDGGAIVGFRAFMRWEFVASGRTFRAVRAVDTATAPSHQGQGIFRRLTLHGIEALTVDGVDFVFNTPNSLSRPGYLKMGWQVVGRLPTRVRPTGVRSLVRMMRARVPASLWSEPTGAGLSVEDWLTNRSTLIDGLAARRRSGKQVQTALSAAYLRWRYGFEPLSYRVWPLGGRADDGGIVFRLRRRGPVLEAAITDALASRAVSGRQLRSLLGASGADYGLALDSGAIGGMLPLPKQGPTLTARSVAGEPPTSPRRWSLALGDVELF